MLESDVEAWIEARAGGDDRAALASGLRMVASGACPLPIRLCLPGCWQRARGLDDLDECVDSLAALPGTPGAERALLKIAAGRLHPAALATTDALEPRLLLLAAARGALARGLAVEAAPLLSLLAASPRPHDLFARVAQAEAAALGAPLASVVAAPPGPPSAALTARIGAAMLARARALRAQGLVVDALGVTELAWQVAAPPDDASLGSALLTLAGDLRRLLFGPADARPLLEHAVERARGAPAEATLRARAQLALAACWLEEDQPASAAAQAAALVDDASLDAPERAAALLTQGVASLALERWDDGDALLQDALRLDPPGETAASCWHWLGVSQAARGLPAAIESLRRALALRASALSTLHPDHAETLVALGTALLGQGERAEAARCYLQAHGQLAACLGPAHPRTRLAAECQEDLRAWLDAVALEQALAEAPLDDPEWQRKLLNFQGFILFRSQRTGGLLTMPHEDTLRRAAVVFTTPDLAEAFLDQLAEPVRREVLYTTLSGDDLRRCLREQEADGVVFNCTGASPRALPLSGWVA